MPRTVVVTGASSGVGRATARAFAARGDRVGLLARNRDGLDAAAKEVVDLGGEPLVVELDVADAQAVEDAAAEVERTLGPIDVWVNNAMTAVLAPVHETTADEFRRVTEVTYLGYVYGSLAALARMRPRNRGTIVQVGSGLAYRAIPLQASYCAAKHAIRGFTDSLRSELMHERSAIKVTMVQLPGLNTPQFDQVETSLPNKPRPVPPVYQPEVAAKAIVWASEHPRREVWVGGVTPAMIWADRFVPSLVDRYLGRTGFKSQQDDEPLEAGRRSYLWEPVPGDRGAHGRFDDEAKARSLQLEVATRRGAAVLGAAATAGATAAAVRWATRRGPR